MRVLAEELSSIGVESADVEARCIVGLRAGSRHYLAAGACWIVTDHFGRKVWVVTEELVEGVVEELVTLVDGVFPWVVE